MKLINIIAINFCQLLAIGVSAQLKNTSAKPLAFTHVTIISVSAKNLKDALREDQTVIIAGNRITETGKSAKVSIPKNAEVVNASGKFMIPGLWDMHMHFEISGKEESFPMYIANGVTGVRDMGGNWDQIKRLRKRPASENPTAPRIVAAGFILDGKTPGFPLRVTVENALEARHAVDSLKKDGVDFIKVHNMLTKEAYFAIAVEAKKQGLPFAGHVPYSVTATEASNAGQKSIEHLSGLPSIYDDKKAKVLFALFVRNRTWQCPTLVALRSIAFLNDEDFTNDARIKYIPTSVKESWNFQINTFFKSRTPEAIAGAKTSVQVNIMEVGAMYQAGIDFIAGSDVGFPYLFPGFSLHDELALIVQAGLTPMEALRTATINPAKFLGREKELGTIEKGKLADLALLDLNPLDDIHNTRKINAVVVNGKYYSRSDLDKMLLRVEESGKKK